MNLKKNTKLVYLINKPMKSTKKINKPMGEKKRSCKRCDHTNNNTPDLIKTPQLNIHFSCRVEPLFYCNKKRRCKRNSISSPNPTSPNVDLRSRFLLDQKKKRSRFLLNSSWTQNNDESEHDRHRLNLDPKRFARVLFTLSWQREEQKMKWEPREVKDFLECKSKCLVYTEAFCAQHVPNLRKNAAT